MQKKSDIPLSFDDSFATIPLIDEHAEGLGQPTKLAATSSTLVSYNLTSSNTAPQALIKALSTQFENPYYNNTLYSAAGYAIHPVTYTPEPLNPKSLHSSHHGGLSTGDKVAIGICVPLGIILLFWAIFVFFCKNHRHKRSHT